MDTSFDVMPAVTEMDTVSASGTAVSASGEEGLAGVSGAVSAVSDGVSSAF
ncbi:hypothetical protein D3C72_2578030 [compost metagenome]